MGLINRESRPAAAPAVMKVGMRPRPPGRFVSEFENEIRQLYVRMIDEPVPPRMIAVVRAGLIGPKS
jgi:hypothetical protein